MRSLFLLALLALPMAPTPASARHFSPERRCYERVETQEWVRGTWRYPGHWRPRYETIEVACDHGYRRGHAPRSCDPARGIIGGIFGGAAGAGLSRQDGRAWAVPLGVGVGALLGCATE